MQRSLSEYSGSSGETAIARPDAKEIADNMSETERIDFIMEHGTETMKAGMKAVFNGNKYKPKRPEMWENHLDRGRKMVVTILRKREEKKE